MKKTMKSSISDITDCEKCEYCQNYENSKLNFCANCGKKLRFCKANELKKALTGIEYLEFYMDADKLSRRMDLPASIMELYHTSLFSPNHCEEFRRILSEIVNNLEMRDDDDIYIVDIVNIILGIVGEKKKKIIGKIKEVEVYTKEEYEKKYYPFLKYCPNWMEKSFKYQNDIYRPFTKNKLYIISSCYSNALNNCLAKYLIDSIEERGYAYSDMGEVLDDSLRSEYLRIGSNYDKNLSRFEISAKTIGKVKKENLLIVLAGLNGIELDEEGEEDENEDEEAIHLCKIPECCDEDNKMEEVD